MCGIIGYIGSKDSISVLMNGLKRMEYRGYDSSGIAVSYDDKIFIKKRPGKIAQLEGVLGDVEFLNCAGIGHTRWATHGEPNQKNAHPHLGEKGDVVINHNGIIENYDTIKQDLSSKGHTFRSDTDTEVLAHLIEAYYEENTSLEEAVRLALSHAKGTYGLVVLSKREPEKIVAARLGSPIVIGLGEDENFVASDPAAIIDYTKQVTYLDDGELAILTREGVSTKTIDNMPVKKEIEEIGYDLERISKSGFEHFMLKEIMEQPQTLLDALRGRILFDEGIARLGGLEKDFKSLLYARRILITACGTSWHAALIGEYLLEEFVRIPVEVEYASEFRYRDPVLDNDCIVLAISQSGETADTLAALREARRKGVKVFGICNTVGSTIARETDAGVYLHAGPEIGVASTKAFTSQVTVLTLITLLLARMRSMSARKGVEITRELAALPDKIKKILDSNDYIRKIAAQYKLANNFLYLGRGYNFPVALEGALKMKEISYIHAEGYPAAEMKHGPIALIDQNMPVVFIATKDSTYDKIVSNIEEVKARKGMVIAIATEGDEEIKKRADHVIYVPETLEMLTPILTSIPLQLLAYHVAILRGCDVDQPRNLAKSVTVE